MGLREGDQALGRYTVGGLLGEGGMGQVWRGEHTDLGMPVALKVLLGADDVVALGRFKREAQLMAKVRHPNVVSVLDYGALADGSPCIVMEFVQGESLERRMEGGVRPWSDALGTFRGLLRGLGAIHAQGLVHRDLKPANVVIAPGSPETPKLIDFGIARAIVADTATGAGAKLTSTGTIIGTPAYMPPEQFMGGEIDARTDVYSAGLVLYEMLTGEVPFADEPHIMACLFKRANQRVAAPVAPAGLPVIPAGLARAVLAALEADPAKRPESARAFFELLRESVLNAPDEDPATNATMASATPAMMMTAPAMAAARSGVRSKWLVGARLPPSRLAHPDDRRFLSGLADGGRAFVFGGQFWFALHAAEGDAKAAEAQAQAAMTALEGRFGSLARARWCPVAEDFQLTAAALSGAKPLPPTLGELLAQLRSA